jgi:hypothetical protein
MHAAGEIMLSLRYGRMDMDGNRDGTSREGDGDVLRDYPVAPTEMTGEMYMLGAMWAPSDAITLTGMLPYRRVSMDHTTRSGRDFTTRSDGIGDVRVSGLLRLHDSEVHHLHANLGFSAPTGSISEKDDTPMGRTRLPYPMQLGSGTWDLLPGVTYSGRHSAWEWGAQASGTIRLGRNHRDYRLGHRWAVTGWVSRELTPWLSTSLRTDYQDWNDIEGDDDGLNPRLVPTADPELRGGRRLDLLFGVNFLVTGGALRGNRFAVEVGAPVWQHLDGPQLETDWRLTAGWQLAF